MRKVRIRKSHHYGGQAKLENVAILNNAKRPINPNVAINKIVQHYSNHPTILKIRKNFDNLQTVEQFQVNSVTNSEIYKLFKNIGDKKATGTDKIRPKLVKI